MKTCGITQITMNVVIVEKGHAPKGVTPIRWVPLTSLSVETLHQAWTVVGYYELRWTIEEYHRVHGGRDSVVKTDCGIEQHALRTAARLEPLIALISVRLLQLKTISKHAPTPRPATASPNSGCRR